MNTPSLYIYLFLKVVTVVTVVTVGTVQHLKGIIMRKIPHHAQCELIEIPRPEAIIQKQIVDYLRAQNYLVIRLNSLCTRIGGRYVRAYWVFGLTHPSKGAPDLWINNQNSNLKKKCTNIWAAMRYDGKGERAAKRRSGGAFCFVRILTKQPTPFPPKKNLPKLQTFPHAKQWNNSEEILQILHAKQLNNSWKFDTIRHPKQ